MKIKFTTLPALFTLIFLFSCSKEGMDHMPSPQNGDKVIILKLAFVGDIAYSRASIEAPITSTVVPGLNVVDVYLYNKKTGVVHCEYSLNSDELTLASALEGLQLTNLHADINAIAVVCNNTVEKDLSIGVDEQISALFAKKVDIALEQDFNNITYLGSDIDLAKTCTPDGGCESNDYFKAEISLTPLVARVEISGIRAMNLTTTESKQYTDLLLKSVFLEAVYSTDVRLDYLSNPSASKPTKLIATTADTEGSTQKWWLEVIEDPNLDAHLSSTRWSPSYESSNKTGVFAFNIFENGDVPTIGLHVEATTIDGKNLAGYVRFSDYEETCGDINQFYAGKIYKISPDFEGKDVTTFNEDAEEIKLFITVQDWSVSDNIIAGDASLSWVSINMGTKANPKWLKVADRNAELGAKNGSTLGAGTENHGYYYQWSNSVSDAADSRSTNSAEKAHQACYDFGEGCGAWRLPRLDELEIIMGKGISRSNSSRKVKWDGSEWKLYDERDHGQIDSFIYFQMGGIIVRNSGNNGNANVGGEGAYWSSTAAGSDSSWRVSLRRTGESVVGGFKNNFGLNIRCVKDA